MQTCPDTGIAIPECCCARCVERQLNQFAPGRLQAQSGPIAPGPLPVQRGPVHDPLLLSEVRSPAPIRPVLERLTRPAL